MKSLEINKINNLENLKIEELVKRIEEIRRDFERKIQSSKDKIGNQKKDLENEISVELKRIDDGELYWNYVKLENINLEVKTNQKKWETFLKKVEKKDPKIVEKINQLEILEQIKKENEKELQNNYSNSVKDLGEVLQCKNEVKRLEELKEKEIEQQKRKEELRKRILESEQFIIFVDGAKNRWGGKYGITDEDGREIETGNNSRIYEQIEIEAYAILKGINWAKENSIKSLKIMTDCQVLSYGEDFNSKTSAGKYYWLARKIAKDENINLEFEWISGKENKADYLTRN